MRAAAEGYPSRDPPKKSWAAKPTIVARPETDRSSFCRAYYVFYIFVRSIANSWITSIEFIARWSNNDKNFQKKGVKAVFSANHLKKMRV